MQRVAALALGRAACVSTRRAGSAIRGHSTLYAWRQQSSAAPLGVTSLRQLHSSRLVAAGPAGGTFIERGDATARILAVVKGFEKVDPTKVTDIANFKDDLGLDSLDAVEVVMAIEDEFTIEIPDSEADKILTVADAVSFIITHPAAK